MRDHFEAYMKSGSPSGCNVGVQDIWKWVCIEVVLRGCRGMALSRMQQPEDQETISWNNKVLNNYAGGWQFWSPLKTEKEWYQLERLEVK